MQPSGLVGEITPISASASILTMTGEIDLATVDLLSELFRTVVESGHNDVIVDMSAVTFIDSTGLHALVEGKQLLHDEGSRLFLVPSTQVRRVLELCFPEPLFATRVETVEIAIDMMSLPTAGSEIPIGD